MVLRGLAIHALSSTRRQTQELVSDLVELIPALALQLADQLGRPGAESFVGSLRHGILASGSAAVSPLGRLLRSPAPQVAESSLELLVEIGTVSAAGEIVDAITASDEGLILRALPVVSTLKLPIVTSACVRLFLTNRVTYGERQSLLSAGSATAPRLLN